MALWLAAAVVSKPKPWLCAAAVSTTMPGNESRSAQKQKRGKTAALVTPESEILIDLADWCVSAPHPRALCVCVCVR